MPEEGHPQALARSRVADRPLAAEVLSVSDRQPVPKVAGVSGPPAAKRLLELVTAHHVGVWRFLRRLGLNRADADDALQETIVIVARRLGEVALGSERSFFYGAALRVAHGAWRRRARRAEVDDDSLSGVVGVDPPQDALLEQRQMRELLDALLRRMPEELRTVFVLYEIEGFTMAEIARMLSLRPGTVASRLRRGRADFEQRVARLEGSSRHEGGQP